MRHTLLMSCCVVAGCVGGPELDDREDPPPVAPPDGLVPFVAGEQEQGRLLLGTYADRFVTSALGYFHAGSVPTTHPTLTIGVQGAQLVAREGGNIVFAGTAAGFLHMRLPTPFAGGGELEIVGVNAVSANVVRYQLVHHTLKGPVPYCADGGGAVPFKGRWSETRLHVNDASTISFGCDGAVGYKCTAWGYVAGAAGPGSIGWDHNQACTRMASADYCGDGKPHTFDGTAIVIRDLVQGAMPDLDDPNVAPLQHAPHPAPPSQFWFESAWQPTIPPAKCLSRVRWASMALGGPCPGVLDDPRTVPGALYCEDYWPDRIAADGSSLLFNASKVGQMLLHRWSTNSGQQLATVRGWKDTRGTEAPYTNYVNYEGPVGFLMRNPPSSLQGQLATVHSLRDPLTNDRYVGFAEPGYDKVGLEGYVYTVDNTSSQAGIPDRIELHLYENGSDRVTSTSPPPGFPTTPVATLGFVDEHKP